MSSAPQNRPWDGTPAAFCRGRELPGHRRQCRDRLLRRGVIRRHRGRGDPGQPRQHEGPRGHGLDPVARLRRTRAARATGPRRPVVPEGLRGQAGPRSSRRGGPQRRGRTRRPSAPRDRRRPRVDVRHQPPRPLRAHAVAGPPPVHRAVGPHCDGGKLRGTIRATAPRRPAVDPGLPAQARLRPIEAGADVLRLRTRSPPAPSTVRRSTWWPTPEARWTPSPRPARRCTGQGVRAVAGRPSRPRRGGGGRAAVGAQSVRPAWHTTAGARSLPHERPHRRRGAVGDPQRADRHGSASRLPEAGRPETGRPETGRRGSRGR